MLGVGDFYYELGVQIIEVCLALKHRNGGEAPSRAFPASRGTFPLGSRSSPRLILSLLPHPALEIPSSAPFGELGPTLGSREGAGIRDNPREWWSLAVGSAPRDPGGLGFTESGFSSLRKGDFTPGMVPGKPESQRSAGKGRNPREQKGSGGLLSLLGSGSGRCRSPGGCPGNNSRSRLIPRPDNPGGAPPAGAEGKREVCPGRQPVSARECPGTRENGNPAEFGAGKGGIEWEAPNSVALEPMLDPQFLVFSGILRDRCLELEMIFSLKIQPREDFSCWSCQEWADKPPQRSRFLGQNSRFWG